MSFALPSDLRGLARTTLRALLAALAFGGAAGFLLALREVLANRHLDYGMHRLALLELQAGLIHELSLVCAGSLGALWLGAASRPPIRALWRRLGTHGAESLPGRLGAALGACVRPRVVLPLLAFGITWWGAASWVHTRVVATPTLLVPSLAAGLALLVALRAARPTVLLAATGLGSLLLLAGTAWGAGSAGTAGQLHRPNVVLIVVDTLRADHLGCYGHELPTSPHIDAFASGAVLFERALSLAPWTTPSIAGMLTSRYPAEVSWRHPPVPIPVRTLTAAEVFRNAGYQTAAFVSHLYVADYLGFDQGFERFDQSEAGGPDHIASPGLAQMALDFIAAPHPAPFFLLVHDFDPHWSYLVHPPYDFDPDYRGPLRGVRAIGELRSMGPRMSAADLRYVSARYDSEIRFVDDYVGRILAALRARGLYDDTAIVFTGDHGEEFGERGDGYVGHGTRLYQTEIHVPLLVKPPWMRRGHREHAWVSLLDLTPTLMAMAGLPAAPSWPFRGRPLPLAHEAVSRPIFSENEPEQSLVLAGWKLLRPGPDAGYELYDLSTDPGERHDRASLEPERLARMKARLAAWRKSLERGNASSGTPRDVFTEQERERLRALGYLN